MSTYTEYEYTNNEYDHTQNYIFEPILNSLKGRKELKILDLGCGNGSLANRLISLGYDVYGVDASVSGINIAKKTNPDRFFCYDLTSENIPPEIRAINFDVILSTEVIEHVYSPKSFIVLCKTILKDSKHKEIILTTPYHGFLKNLILSLTNKWDHHLNPLWEGGHIKFWSKNTLIKLLSEHNFSTTNFIGCGRMPYVWKSMLIHAKINE